MRKISRRGLMRVGAGLLGFIPAAKSLLELPIAQAGGTGCPPPPGYVTCSKTFCVYIGDVCVPRPGYTYGRIHRNYACYDYYSTASCPGYTEPTDVSCNPGW
jgi:hypothetical protein